MPLRSDGRSGPAIYANDPWLPGRQSRGTPRQLLSEREQAKLAAIASIVRFKKGELIYKDGEEAKAAFNIISGVVTTTSNGGEHVTAFLYAGDLLGLSREGRYTNTARATTAVVAYALPIARVRKLLLEDAALDVDVIVKLCHELRQTQRHALLLAQKHAASRLAMFLDLQEHLQTVRGEHSLEIYLPMSRSAIADYLGLSLGALSRAFGAVVADGIIESRDLRHVRIVDRAALKRLATANDRPSRRSNAHRLHD